MSKRAKKFLKMAKTWTKNKFSKKIFFLANSMHIKAYNLRKKSSMLLHSIRNYFSSLSKLQAPFSNLLTRANNRRPYSFSSIFHELFVGTGLIHPEMSRKLAIFTNKNVKKNGQKLSFLVPKTFCTEFLHFITMTL